jgi:hypothetical protein
LIEATLVTKKLNFSSAGLAAPAAPVVPAVLAAPAFDEPADGAPPEPAVDVLPPIIDAEPLVLVVPLVFALVPAVEVDAAPLVGVLLAPAAPSPFVSGELQARTTASTSNAAQEFLATIQ